MKRQNWHNLLARAGILGLITGLMVSSFSLSVSDLEAQAGPLPTPTETVGPEAQCPRDDQIDVNPNRYETDCRSLNTDLDYLKANVTCDGGSTPSGQFASSNPWGKIICDFPLVNHGGGTPPDLIAFPGCVDVSRSPWPRAIVGRPLSFTLRQALFNPDGATLQGIGVARDFEHGWYAILPSPGGGGSLPSEFRVGGNFLGQGMGEAMSSSGWATLNLWPAAQRATTFPSVAFVRARLVLRHVPGAGQVYLTGSDVWAEFKNAPEGMVATLKVRRTSGGEGARNGNDLPGSGGGQGTGPNNLPAYRVLVQTSWEAFLEVQYRAARIQGHTYIVDGEDAWHTLYSMDNGTGRFIGSYISYRAWDSRITNITGVESNICRASAMAGYQPIAVLEGQSVLTR